MKRPFAAGQPIGPLGLVPREWGGGTAVWEYTVNPEHFNPAGALHGGVVMTLLDTAMGHAVAELVIPEGRFNVAAQMNVHFLHPVREGVIRATGTVRKLGKRLAFVEGEVTDAEGRVLATASATHSLLP